MACVSAIGVHDDLTPGQAAVTVWPADDKTPCGIDEELGIPIYHLLRKHFVKYIFPDILMDLLLRHIRVMLGRKHHSL